METSQGRVLISTLVNSSLVITYFVGMDLSDLYGTKEHIFFVSYVAGGSLCGLERFASTPYLAVKAHSELVDEVRVSGGSTNLGATHEWDSWQTALSKPATKRQHDSNASERDKVSSDAT
jgi:hypothetical protein